jgi:hypothetical protein
MGWASGSQMGEQLYKKIRPFIKKENRKEVALDIYSTFCDEDADDWNPTSHLLKDAGIKFED